MENRHSLTLLKYSSSLTHRCNLSFFGTSENSLSFSEIKENFDNRDVEKYSRILQHFLKIYNSKKI